MQGHVARKGNHYYAVIYEGLGPMTGRDVADGIRPAPIGSTPRCSPGNLLMSRPNGGVTAAAG